MNNYDYVENCKPIKGAKRLKDKDCPELKQKDEECYVEGAYEASLEYDLKESNAKLNELNKQFESVLNEDECLNFEQPKRIKTNKLFAKGIITPTYTKVTEFTNNPDDLNNPNNSKDLKDSNTSKDSDDPKVSDGLNLKTTRHPNTIRKYTSVLLNFFSNLETEYVNDDGYIFTEKLPVFYASREKLVSIEQHEFESLTNGNTNFLPRASLIIDSLTYNSQRQINKNSNTTSIISNSSLASSKPYAEVQQAPSPYDINVRLNIVTRGMNDALMLCEQICSQFNPFLEIPILEGPLNVESNVRLKLEGVTFEPPTFDEYSQNEVISEYTFVMYGNLYKLPGKEYLIENINANFSF